MGVPILLLAFFLFYAVFGREDFSTIIGLIGSAVSLVVVVVVVALERRQSDADH